MLTKGMCEAAEERKTARAVAPELEGRAGRGSGTCTSRTPRPEGRSGSMGPHFAANAQVRDQLASVRYA